MMVLVIFRMLQNQAPMHFHQVVVVLELMLILLDLRLFRIQHQFKLLGVIQWICFSHLPLHHLEVVVVEVRRHLLKLMIGVMSLEEETMTWVEQPLSLMGFHLLLLGYQVLLLKAKGWIITNRDNLLMLLNGFHGLLFF
uniref:Uncharacterized protein n=1 Tax=Medicago truncatula TaxID=3880 RepID=I3SMH6_MEDTR|nr:unknown [Medicago truncatula]